MAQPNHRLQLPASLTIQPASVVPVSAAAAAAAQPTAQPTVGKVLGKRAAAGAAVPVQQAAVALSPATPEGKAKLAEVIAAGGGAVNAAPGAAAAAAASAAAGAKQTPEKRMATRSTSSTGKKVENWSMKLGPTARP